MDAGPPLAAPASGQPRRDGTLLEHIHELRRRLMIGVIAVVVGTIVGVIWYQTPLFGLPSLGQLLTEPYCRLPRGRA